MKTKTRVRKRGLQKDRVNFDESVKLWASFYRSNMHRFAIDYLNLPLFGFQMILLYMMNINNFFYFMGDGFFKYFFRKIYTGCQSITILRTSKCTMNNCIDIFKRNFRAIQTITIKDIFSRINSWFHQINIEV